MLRLLSLFKSGLVAQIWRPAHLLLEQLTGLPFALFFLLDSLVAHLIVYLNFVFRHLDVFLDNADLFMFLGPHKAEVHVVAGTLCTIAFAPINVGWNGGLGTSWVAACCSGAATCEITVAVELIQLLIRLQVNLVLCIELHRE